MSKVKLFTHTDLDGVGCAILAYLAFGRENVDVEYCEYDNVDEKVRAFCKDGRDLFYDYIFITDISIKEETIDYILNVRDEYLLARNEYSIKWRLFDHHPTALWMNKYGWCTVDTMNHVMGVKTSGTELFYFYLSEHGYFDCMNATTINNIYEFVSIVRDYDTWRWKEELGEEGVVCKQLNDLFYIYGRKKFIDIMVHDLSTEETFPKFTFTDMILLQQKQKDIDIYVKDKNKQMTNRIDTLGHEYGIVFAERYFSELGNRLSDMHPELDYIAIIDICSGKVHYRTAKDDIDVGMEIAHSFGGGGHKKAAGSTFSAGMIEDIITKELFETSNNQCDEPGIYGKVYSVEEHHIINYKAVHNICGVFDSISKAGWCIWGKIYDLKKNSGKEYDIPSVRNIIENRGSCGYSADGDTFRYSIKEFEIL